MIKAVLDPDGEPKVLLGLDDDDVRTLMSGRPITVTGASVGLGSDLVLMVGGSNEEIMADLAIVAALQVDVDEEPPPVCAACFDGEHAECERPHETTQERNPHERSVVRCCCPGPEPDGG